MKSHSAEIAPVILFVYNRLKHTKATVKALQANNLSQQSELYIFSDREKTESDKHDVDAVRDYLSSISGFRSIKIVYRESNYGLAASIISGVSQVIEEHGVAIVLEDDIVTSPHFLTYMNEALNRYQDQDGVWHISGWNYPFDVDEQEEQAFFWRGMNCWGWATWKDRWKHFEKNPDRLISEWSRDDISRFNVDDTTDFWAQVLANKSGKLSTWAIFWYATIFEHNGLCLNPYRTLVDNIGNDGSGENCTNEDWYKSRLESRMVTCFPDSLNEDVRALAKIKKFNRTLTPPFPQRVVRKLKSILHESLNRFAQR